MDPRELNKILSSGNQEEGSSEITEAEIRALAAAYAKYLKNNNMTPGSDHPQTSKTSPKTDSQTGPVTKEVQPLPQDQKISRPAVTQPQVQPVRREIAQIQQGPSPRKAKKPELIIPEYNDPELFRTDNTSGASSSSAESGRPEQDSEIRVTHKRKIETPAQDEQSSKDRSEKAAKKEKKSKKKSEKNATKHNKTKYIYNQNSMTRILSAPIDFIDRIREGISDGFINMEEGAVKGIHNLAITYRQSRMFIGIAVLIITMLAAAMLIVFDHFTVYEYSYNGKVLGYVSNQEVVTDVLGIAGTRLSENNSKGTDIEFTANQNVTFNLVDSTGKSTDDSDMAVNKLVYMTDIEIEAYGVYDGARLVAVVKNNESAESLLSETLDALSRPDDGMELVSAEFINDLSIEPVNVLLTSVQSNTQARELMTKGGSLEVYHILEEGETLATIQEKFGVDPLNIFDESNSEVITEAEQGDKICIRTEVEPVSVRMVEKGRMRETIPYETIKEDSDEYYKGDTYTKQDGEDRVQIFEGTITKESGEITDRKTKKIDVIIEGQDKIILIGTAERPKTAPTGTYAMPIDNYTISSNFGARWGRLHSGLDMAAPTGTPIYATDGGTVVRAGWYAGYGLCVDIDHENGRMSRYGHCSKLLVNVGDKVFQRQNIALVGNTGHSFGSHLHFEVRLNGNPYDPRQYLGI